ncbi:MAG TPA: GNAT family N-acetyltransferase [Anaerolineae bacterium]|nr:GNAT family N-acetyltransferase [Anaerolineae bacterium]
MTTANLSFRPVQSADKDRILAFTRNTWGGEDDDYIQYIFEEWMADLRGEFTAAVIDDRVVGIAKLSDMGDDEWWFEGLRIDPAYRRLGIASEFNRYHVELAKRLGGKVIRYMTGDANVGSQAIGARAGFQHILTYTAHLAEASDEFLLPTLLALADLPALTRWLDSPLMHYLHGVYRNAWVAKTLTEAELRGAVETNLAYGLKDDRNQITAWALRRADEYDDDSEDGEYHRLRVDHLDGDLSAMTELARRIRALATSLHRTEISAGICDYPPLVQAVVEAGYTVNPDNFSLWVLELRLKRET